MSSTPKNEKNTVGYLVGSWIVSILLAIILSNIISYVFWIMYENAFVELPEDEYMTAFERVLMIASIAYVIGVWKDILETQTEARLLIFNVKTDVILGPGPYLLPFREFNVFTIFRKEVVDTQSRDVQLDPLQSQDINKKKVIIEGDGDWEVENYVNYEHFEDKDMKKNLTSLVRKTAIRLFAGKSFESDLHGKELGNLVLTDIEFRRECNRYGVKFNNLMITVISGNSEQDDLLRFEDVLFERFKSRYPNPDNLTEADIAEINRAVDTKLKLAKRFIVDGAGAYGRFNMGDEEHRSS